MKRKENPMPEHQWPPDWRIECVREDIQKPNMRLYEARGLTGMVELRVAQEIDRVMTARHDTPPPTITPTTPTTTNPTKEDHHMTDVTNTAPLRHIPARLDAAACLQILARITDAKTGSIAAAAESVTLADVDAGLATTALSVDDRMRFKHALGQHGIISAGRRTSISRI
jgi:hypothetical protein